MPWEPSQEPWEPQERAPWVLPQEQREPQERAPWGPQPGQLGRQGPLEQQEQRNEELIKYFQALQSIRELEAENGAAGEKKSTKKRTKRAKQ